MNKPLGKNQIALMNFLFKHPNQWHSIKGRSALDAASRLAKRYEEVQINEHNQIYYAMPQMFLKQA